MRVAVIGGNGQIGTELVLAARAAGCEPLVITHADCDVTERASVDRALAALVEGDAAINTAAFHRTDACEAEPERAMAVNAMGSYNVAAAARARGAAVVYLSSDFVFDGAKRSAYVESDAPLPINAYGISQLAGEVLAAQTDPAHYVARVSSVFGVAGSSGKGGNFVETMLAKARAGERIEVVDDIVMAPTSAADAAALIVALLVRRAPFGPYHLANAGECSWRAFADAIFEAAGLATRAVPVSHRDVPASAPRPLPSTLASERPEAVGLSARPWREALDAYMLAKGHRIAV